VQELFSAEVEKKARDFGKQTKPAIAGFVCFYADDFRP